jgi:hypothetical protein
MGLQMSGPSKASATPNTVVEFLSPIFGEGQILASAELKIAGLGAVTRSRADCGKSITKHLHQRQREGCG